jgi:probable rRNA maturation factor
MSIQVNVEIDRRAAGELRGTEDKEVVELAVRVILRREGFTRDRSATVLLTGDDRLHQLNRDFAGEDHATDVLSFEARRGDDFPVADGMVDSIGDIAISIPQAKRQAFDKGIAFKRELAMLAIHGTLHLLGYDHASPDEEQVMFGKTDGALSEIFD